MNKIRKIIRRFGVDIHRYNQKADRKDYLTTLDINTVIDIGANVGQFAKEIRSMLPHANIYSFEPLKECFEELQKNMISDDKFTGFNFALGEKEEVVEMQRNEYLPSSSILQLSKNHMDYFPHAVGTTREKIAIKKLDDVVSQFKLKRELLIKIDAQGFEDKIINGGNETFLQAKVLLVETSFIDLYVGQPLFSQIYTQLTNLGFVYQGSLQEKMDKKSGKIISEDSLFVK